MAELTLEDQMQFALEHGDFMGKSITVSDGKGQMDALDAELDAILELANKQQDSAENTPSPNLRIVPNCGNRVASKVLPAGRQEAIEQGSIEPRPSDNEPGKSASTAKTPNPAYSFPDGARQPACAELDDARLIERLETLMERYEQDKLRSYSTIRNEFCALSLEINRRILMAPRFRQQPKYPKLKSNQRPSDDLASNDRQVIDLHWLRCRDFQADELRAPYKRLFSGTEFDFDLASEFASKLGSPALKADEILVLSRHEQLELAVIQSDAIRREYARLVNGVSDSGGKAIGVSRKKIYQRIKEYTRNHPQLRGREVEYTDLWLARELVGDRPTRVQEFLKLKTGREPVGRRTIEGKLKTLRRILGEDQPRAEKLPEDAEGNVPAE